MSDYYSNFAGSSTANFVFILVLGSLNWLRTRLNRSKCRSNCYVFDCEAHLDEIKHVKSEVQTQRGLLTTLLEMVDSKSLAPIVLEPARDLEEGAPQPGAIIPASD